MAWLYGKARGVKIVLLASALKADANDFNHELVLRMLGIRKESGTQPAIQMSVSYIKGGGTAQLFEKVDGVQYPGELSGVLPGILDKGGGGFIQQSGKTLPVQLFQGNTVLQDLPLRAA